MCTNIFDEVWKFVEKNGIQTKASLSQGGFDRWEMPNGLTAILECPDNKSAFLSLIHSRGLRTILSDKVRVRENYNGSLSFEQGTIEDLRENFEDIFIF